MTGVPEEVFSVVEPMLKRWEGFRSTIYDDGTGVKTIGLGFTAPDFPHGMPSSITPAQSDAVLLRLLNETYWPPVGQLVAKLGSGFNPNRQAGTLDAVYNLGSGILGGDHTFGHYLLAKNWDAAAKSLLEYSMPGTPVHVGLLARREDDMHTFQRAWHAPDPNHYLQYPENWMVFERERFRERHLAQEIDADLRHPHLHHDVLKRDLELAQEALKRIWVVSVFEAPTYTSKRKTADWSDGRGHRYQWWTQRIEKVQKALK